MAKRMTPNQKAWQREMLRIENMARSIGIEDVASIKPKTPEKITKKHIAQAEAITMNYIREKAELDSVGIKPARKVKQQRGKAVSGVKEQDYVKKPRRPLTEEEKRQRVENLRKGKERQSAEQRSKAAQKAAKHRGKSAAKKSGATRAAKNKQIANLPKASDLAVDNFFSDIRDRLTAPRSADDINATQTYYNAMMSLLSDIGKDRFASMLILADQEGAGIYLTLPPSQVDMEWAMGAITALYGVVNKHDLGYGKSVRKVWEDMDESMDSYDMDIE